MVIVTGITETGRDELLDDLQGTLEQLNYYKVEHLKVALQIVDARALVKTMPLKDE